MNISSRGKCDGKEFGFAAGIAQSITVYNRILWFMKISTQVRSLDPKRKQSTTSLSSQSHVDLPISEFLAPSIRRKYWRFRDDQPLPLRGACFKLDRRDMVSFIEDSIAEYNDEARKDGRVRRAFEKCGLNPFIPSRFAFYKHLDSLTQESLYKSKLKAGSSLKLG